MSNTCSAVRGLLILVAALGIALAACSDGDSSATNVTATVGGTPPGTPASSRFPIVIQRDTLVIAAADGSNVREEPASEDEAYFDPGLSPDGTLRAGYRDGQLSLTQVDTGETDVVADVGVFAEFAVVLWAPDSQRLMFDVSADGEMSNLYAVNVDGSGLVNLGEGLSGFASPQAWSADSERVAFGVLEPPATGEPVAQMYVANVDGSERRNVGEFLLPQGDAGWDRPAWSPDGAYIAVLKPGDSGMRVLDLAGAPAKDLGGQGVIHFSWSPDSRSIAFDNRAGDDPLLVGDIAAGTSQELAEGHWPRWSPAGDRIAFKHNPSGEVRSALTDGSALASLGQIGPEARSELTWSADGSELEYLRAAPRDGDIYMVDLGAASATRAQSFLEQGYSPLSQPQLSPDGTQIVFVAVSEAKEGTPEGLTGSFVMDLATGDTTLTNPDVRGGQPYWGDGGVRLALASGTDGVYVDDAASAPRQVSTVEAFQPPAWSPDGTKVAILGPGDIYVVDVATGEEQKIALGLVPEVDVLQNLRWSPDGASLLYEVGRSQVSLEPSTDAFVVPAAGGEPRLLLHVQNTSAYATWSPDGESVAFMRPGEGTVELWLIDAGGENERRPAVIDAPEFSITAPYWSPDGASIATVVNGDDMYLIDPESGEATLVATNYAACITTFIGWLPDSASFYVAPQCGLGAI